MQIQRSVPLDLWREVVKPREPVDIKPGVDVYLIRGHMVGQVLLPARILTDTTANNGVSGAYRCGGNRARSTYHPIRTEILRSVPSAKVERKVVATARPKLHFGHKMEVGRSARRTEYHPAIDPEGAHGAEQKKPASEERWKDYGLNLQWGETERHGS